MNQLGIWSLGEFDWSAIGLSLKIVSVSLLLNLVVGTAVAYFLAFVRFPGKWTIEGLLTLPLVLPPTVLGYYLVLLLGREGMIGAWWLKLTDQGILFTWQAGVIASFLVSLPLMIKTTQASFSALNRNHLYTSWLLGHSAWKTFFKVILPLSHHGIWAGLILSFARGIGEFGATLMVAGNIAGKTMTMPLAIYTYASQGDWKQAHALSLILTILSLLFLLLSNFLIRKRKWS